MWFSYIDYGEDHRTAELYIEPISAESKEEAVEAVQKIVNGSKNKNLVLSACIVSGCPDDDGELIFESITDSFLVAIDGENLKTPVAIIL